MTRARSLSRLANSQAFTVDSDLDVGINSTSPSSKLDVGGDIIVSGVATISNINSTNVTAGVVTATTFDGTLSGNATSATTATTATTATNVTVADESTDTSCNVLFTTAATGDLAPKSGTNLTFNSSTGALTATSFVGSLTGNATGLSGTPNIDCGTGSFTGDVDIADKIIHTGDTDTAIRFPAADTFTVETAGSEALRIGSAGQIGLGGANYGTSGQVITSNGSSSAPTWQDAGVTLNDDTSTNSNMFPMFASSSSGTLTTAKVSSTKLTYNPSTGRLTSTSINSSSDENLKKDITSVGSALDKVKKLRGVDYTWKDTNEKGKGVIAQELQEVFPELVSEEPNGYLSVNYNGLIAVLIEAIKELSDK